MVGVAITGMGYYTVICGQIKGDDEEITIPCDKSTESLNNKVPLLQEKMQV